MFLFESFKHPAIVHAEKAFPEEACGVVFHGKYVPCENVDEEPEKFFAFSKEDEFKYLIGGMANLTQALVHSHPVGPCHPTKADMRMQIATGLPCILLAHDGAKWVYIEWGDHMLDVPLLERPFVHGVLDCYSLIRAWYWQTLKVRLKDYARDDQWWAAGQDMYAEFFADCGFREIDPGEACNQLQEGDVFLYKLAGPGGGPKVESHGGVYIGNGLILHHLPGRSSEEAQLGPWMRRVSRWVRYSP